MTPVPARTITRSSQRACTSGSLLTVRRTSRYVVWSSPAVSIVWPVNPRVGCCLSHCEFQLRASLETRSYRGGQTTRGRAAVCGAETKRAGTRAVSGFCPKQGRDNARSRAAADLMVASRCQYAIRYENGNDAAVIRDAYSAVRRDRCV